MSPSALRLSTLALAAAAALAAPGFASAGGSVSIGVGIGGPGYYGGYYGGPRPYYGGGWYGYGPRYYGPGPYYYGPPAVYAYPYPYPPAVTVVPVQPPVYVERDSGYSAAPQAPAPQASQPLESGFWYYCRNPAGYYPNVAECAGGWEKVPPRPPGAQ